MKTIAGCLFLTSLFLGCYSLMIAQSPTPLPTSTPPAVSGDLGGEKKEMSGEVKKSAIEELDQEANRYSSKGAWYAFGYFLCVIGSGLLSGLAGLLPQLSLTKDKPRTKDISSILAFAAAVLITVNTQVNFDVNWKANKNAMTEVHMLRTEVLRDRITTIADVYQGKDEIFQRKQQRVLNLPAPVKPSPTK